MKHGAVTTLVITSMIAIAIGGIISGVKIAIVEKKCKAEDKDEIKEMEEA